MRKSIISKVDSFTKAGAVMDTDHVYIHDGLSFAVIGSTTIANSGTYKLQFTTAALDDPSVVSSKQNYVHWRPATVIGTGGGLTWELFEGSTTISGGSSDTAINLNRNSSRTSQVTVKKGVTVGTDGTSIQIAGSGTAGNAARAEGGQSGADHERVLKPDTEYTLTITNLLAGDNLVIWELFWYEEDEGI